MICRNKNSHTPSNTSASVTSYLKDNTPDLTSNTVRRNTRKWNWALPIGITPSSQLGGLLTIIVKYCCRFTECFLFACKAPLYAPSHSSFRSALQCVRFMPLSPSPEEVADPCSGLLSANWDRWGKGTITVRAKKKTHQPLSSLNRFFSKAPAFGITK